MQQSEIKKIITIDGPAGSGKSTLAKMLAEQIHWDYITTGAIYRTLAMLIKESGNMLTYDENIEPFIDQINNTYKQDCKTGHIFLGAKDISSQIRTPEISQLSSILAKEKNVREKLLPIQRKIVLESQGAIVEGRDMGTVVFPDASLKIYLTASPKQRVERRLLELKASGKEVDFDKLLDEINERDVRDSSRSLSPLKPAADAITLDSTDISPLEIAKIIIKYARDKKLI